MGKLVFNFGAMNSGKSAKLLQLAYQLEQAGVPFQVATAEKHTGRIDSRLGISRECTHIDGLLNLMQHPNVNPEYVLIDECQWLRHHHIEKLRKLNCIVICYGLRTDTDGYLFPASELLFRFADELVHNHSFCECCSKPAILHNYKKDPALFGKSKFESVCYEHFTKGK